MQIEKIKIKNIGVIAYVYFCLDYNNSILSKNKFVGDLIKDIPRFKIGYAGFRTKKRLKKHLILSVFGSGKIKKIPKINFNKKIILKIIERSIKKCYKIFPLKPTRIFVFPSFNTFKKRRMQGIGGFCPGKSNILIDLNPTSGWKNALEKVIYHEFNHSIVSLPPKKWALIDSLIFEGLADNFIQHFCHEKLPPWSKALSLKESKKFFKKIKNLLSLRSYKIHCQVFFENKKYPLWTGYSIGYQIVKSFLKKYKHLGWRKIMKLNPEEILEKSGFEQLRYRVRYVPPEIIGEHLACYYVEYKGKKIRPRAAIKLKIPLNEIWISEKLKNVTDKILFHELQEIRYRERGDSSKSAHKKAKRDDFLFRNKLKK